MNRVCANSVHRISSTSVFQVLTMILNETAHANGVPNGINGVKKATSSDSTEAGSRYWGKRYVPNEGESFEVRDIAH